MRQVTFIAAAVITISVRAKERIYLKRLSVLLATFILLNTSHVSAVPPVRLQYETLVPGLSYACYQTNNPSLYVHVVKVDLLQKGIKVGAVKAKGRESVAQLAERYTTDKYKAVAVINGDNFDGDEKIKGPWGMHIQKGEVMYTPALKRSTFLVGLDGLPMIDIPRLHLKAQFGSSQVTYDIGDMNRHYKIGEPGLHLFSSNGDTDRVAFKDATCMMLDGGAVSVNKAVKYKITDVVALSGDVAVPVNGFVLCYRGSENTIAPEMKNGTEVRISAQIEPSAAEAVAGGPRILRNGQVTLEFDKEGYTPVIEACLKRVKHPRSAVGYSSDRHFLFLVTIEGRVPRSGGMNMEELADFLLALGASDAMAFDGGGSATLFTEKYKSETGENKMRNVANGLAVFQCQDESK